jgi:MFS family permease
MGLYSFFLAGSNYFAPVICGFIAQYQSWQWVFYYPSIFLGCCFLFLFFFMEETNYDRKTVGIVADPSQSSSASVSVSSAALENVNNGENDPEKSPLPQETSSNQREAVEIDSPAYKKKTYVQKLSLLSTREKNNILRRSWHGLYFASWPVIFYAG